MTLKDQTIRAFVWVSSARAVSQTFSWLISILLARVLLPSDFGLVALAWVVVGFLDLINELGVGAAIVQKKDLDTRDINAVFWLSLGTAALLYALVFVLAPSLAGFFGNEHLTMVIRLLAITVILAGFRTIPFNLLTKDLAFGKRSLAEFSSIVIGGCFSVTLALNGYGVWSLVTGTLAQHAVLTGIVFTMSAWKPEWVFDLGRAKRLLTFGTSVMSSRVLWYTYISADSLIIGKVLGERLLGYYSMATQLSTLPVQKVTGIVNQVAFPVFSKLQEDPIGLKVYFLKITKFVALITFPTMVGLYLVSENLVRVLLTEKWLPSVEIFKLLCVIGLLKSIDAIIPNLLMAKGKPNLVVRFNLLCIVAMPAAFIIGAQYGIQGVGYAWLVTYPLISLYLYWHGLQETGTTWWEYSSTLAPAFVASLLMAAGIFAFQSLDVAWYGKNLYLAIGGAVLVGVTTYLLSLVSFHKDVMTEVRDVIATLRAKPQTSTR